MLPYPVRCITFDISFYEQIDDFFPCYPHGGPLFASSHGPEMWVLLLEKAFAKYCGSYEALISGWSYQAMMDLTGTVLYLQFITFLYCIIVNDVFQGAPFAHYKFKNVDIAAKIADGKLWEELLQFDAVGYLISAAAHSKEELAEFMRTGSGKVDNSRPSGLRHSHAYTVLTVSNIP